ncbi:MAG TPA: hypothetical protein VK249_16185 [Anaerolineales bacterium]|nr:hypothetical protein [Anaerolineales bacterium]
MCLPKARIIIELDGNQYLEQEEEMKKEQNTWSYREHFDLIRTCMI